MKSVVLADGFFSFMANATPDIPTNALLDYLTKNAKNPGQQTSQALQTIMQNPQLASAYNDRANFYNSTNQDMAKTIDDQAKNGVNGMAVNVSPNVSSLASELPQNQAMTNTFLAGLLQQAQGGVNNTENNATNITTQGMQTGLGEQQLQMNQRLNGIDPSTGNFNGADTGNAGGTGSTTGNSGTTAYSPQAVEQLKVQGAKDLFPDGMSVPQQMQVMNEIQKAGGLANFRKSNPQSLSKDDAGVLGATNTTLRKITDVQNQLQTSKALKAAIDNPASHSLLSMNNQWIDQYILGLSPKDVQALSDLTTLNATNDKNQVGGRITGYLLNMIGPSGVGVGHTSEQNQQLLQRAKQSIIKDNLTPLAKGYGFDSVYDLPYVQFGQQSAKHPNGAVNLTGPDGKTYMVDQSEAGQALQNGWKEAQ